MKQTIEIGGRQLTEQQVQSSLLELPRREGGKARQGLKHKYFLSGCQAGPGKVLPGGRKKE